MYQIVFNFWICFGYSLMQWDLKSSLVSLLQYQWSINIDLIEFCNYSFMNLVSGIHVFNIIDPFII